MLGLCWQSISISENSNSLEESPEEYEEISADKETEDPSQNPVKMVNAICELTFSTI